MRLWFARLGPLVAAAALAVACGGSQNGGGEPVDIDLAAASEFLSRTAESDPVDADDAPADDGSNIRPDLIDSDATAAASDTAAVDSVATANDSGTAAVDSDAVDGAGGAVEAESGTENVRTTAGTDGWTVDASDPEAPDDGPVAPLTGELTSNWILAQRRALAVKVGNGDGRSRPQAGLAAADIVYELLIEGAATRFMAVFHSEMPSRIGPVRSVRSGDLDLLADLSTPYLVSSGANTTVLAEMRQAERAGTFVDVGGLRLFAPYSRDASRRSPFNLYFHYENLVGNGAGAVPGGPVAAPVLPLFDFGSTNSAGIADAIGVTVAFHRSSGNVVSHVWDAAVGGWVRIQQGALMTTETDFGLTEVAPVNVVVAWMPYGYSPATTESPKPLPYGTGQALVLTAGAVHDAVWERTEDRAGFRFSDAAGNPLSLSPGSTWVLIANSSRRFAVAEAAVLTVSDGTRLLADARAAASAAANAASGS